jgi:hypothetical protein
MGLNVGKSMVEEDLIPIAGEVKKAQGKEL